MVDRRTVLVMGLGLVGVLVVAGCGGGSAGEVVPSAVSVSPSVSRGFEATVIPSWVRVGVARRAAEFVAVAATPDVRVDEQSGDAWRRASSMMAPELVAELEEDSALGSFRGWGWLQRLDGYVSVEISNVIGDEPQAAPGPEEPASPIADADGVEVEVVFSRVIHADRQPDVRESSEPLVWQVRVVDDRVVGVRTVTTTATQ